MHSDPVTTSSSRAGPRPRFRSTTPVTKLVERVAAAAWNAVSSTPTVSTPTSRVGSSTRGVPCSRTAAIAVRQLTPKSRATAATEAPSSPMRRQISARARAVSDARAAMHGEVSVHARSELGGAAHVGVSCGAGPPGRSAALGQGRVDLEGFAGRCPLRCRLFVWMSTEMIRRGRHV
jgi:hypothetical protein